jgi:hypothetical protein
MPRVSRWTVADDLVLRQMLNTGLHSYAEIGERLGKTVDQVAARRSYLRMPAPRSVVSPCTVRDRLLALMARRKLTWRGVASRMAAVPEGALLRWGKMRMPGSPDVLAAAQEFCAEMEAPKHNPSRAPNAFPPPDPTAILPVEACAETVADWLYAEWLRRGHKHAGAMEGLNAMTTRGRYAEANALRLAYGLSPFVPADRSMAA